MNQGHPVWSHTKIDIVIPAAPKDISVLPHTIEGARQNIRHPIGSIAVVAPDDPKIRALCKRYNCAFFDESGVVPIAKNKIDYTVNEIDRAGWIFQQLIKFSGNIVCAEEHYLVIDADTVFIRPNAFKENGKTVFHYADEYHLPYFVAYERLLGEKPVSPKSFCTHYMLFEKTKVAQLKSTIEERFHIPWYEAILQHVDRTHTSGFADYETYGNFVLSHFPGQAVMKYWNNLSLTRSKMNKTIQTDLRKLASKYNTVSFHSWNK
ncbi:DUF6492 family protein [Paenibacillus ginsengarvi]|uniref:Nucleotide-diphospho-sugar transferase domain-containing protein n=1 Tax=Paenibacillus ginsengarvi TaxID=400777 RepID=A0A3B0BWT5_9BACL|nr:DUF6492 family protein [Paenibacillus ginsengarvi]RKN75906.1 hypothetical protein D7M11_25720 [Paenibacillus ginsengarvi]